MRFGHEQVGVSRRFVAMTKTALGELLAAPLGKLDLVALMIDSVHFGEHDAQHPRDERSRLPAEHAHDFVQLRVHLSTEEVLMTAGCKRSSIATSGSGSMLNPPNNARFEKSSGPSRGARYRSLAQTIVWVPAKSPET